MQTKAGGRAAATKNPRAASAATPDSIKFATTGEIIRVIKKERFISRTKKT